MIADPLQGNKQWYHSAFSKLTQLFTSA